MGRMFFATIDCGTTNSRVHILNQDCAIVGKGSQKIGVRDTAIHGSNQVLREGLAALFARTVAEGGLALSDVRLAITSGMITSELGLLEIPHLRAPAGIEHLARSVTYVDDRKVFPLEVPILFIRGIKNAYPDGATYRQIRQIDFMRGEETQIAGLLALRPDMERPLTVVVLSSHTKYISVSRDAQILGSLTTLSGQVFEAIQAATSIGKSIALPDGCAEDDFFDAEVVDAAHEAVVRGGFLRALLMPRFLDVLLGAPVRLRRLFTEAAIGAEDLKALAEFPAAGFPARTAFVLVGQPGRCRPFRHLLETYHQPAGTVSCITDAEEIDRLSIHGAIAIAREAGYLPW
jgi:2-dehydro-3-deoxygalactonokinase